MVDAMRDAGKTFQASFERSEDPFQKGPERSARRTSTSAFCDTRGCRQDPRIKAIEERARELTGTHYEFMQMVRYTQGQYYQPHHDTSLQFGRSATGHRIYTLLIYLNDVERGD